MKMPIELCHMKTTTAMSSAPPLPHRLLLLLMLAIVWFSLLGYRDLIEPDEGRYAEIPLEMFATGDWLTPHLNGFLYFEKPPLQYWATAIFYQLFGVDNLTSRLWVALTGFFGILWTLHVGNRLFGTTAGWNAALILASMLLYCALGHFNTLDMATGVWIFLGIGALLLAQQERTTHPIRCRNHMLLAWAALAGATLSKGLIGLLIPGSTLVLYTLWQRDWTLWRHMHLGKGLLLFFALTTPWFVLVSLKNPDFAQFFFIHEHFDRYATASHSRPGPWYYFIGVLLAGTLPWTGRVLSALRQPGFPWYRGQGNFDPVRLLWVYALFILFFFSLSHSKLIPYIIPMFPALALLAGRHLAESPGKTPFVWEIRTLGILVVLSLLATVSSDLLANPTHPVSMILQLRPWLLGAAATLSLAMLAAWRLPTTTALLVMPILSVLGFQLLTWGAQELSATKSSREAVNAIAAHVPPDTPVYAIDAYFQSLPFYWRHTVIVVNFQGELEFGIARNPDRWIGDSHVFASKWMQSDQAVAVFNRDNFPSWQERQLPMKIIHQDGKRVVVIRR